MISTIRTFLNENIILGTYLVLISLIVYILTMASDVYFTDSEDFQPPLFN